MEDHPRLCGEKRFPVHSFRFTPGITPAYAGKSPAVSRSFSLSRDHPRLCGEKIEERNPSNYVLGSPPPMRGKVYLAKMAKAYDGITPAYAGKSIFGGGYLISERDHPRLCGEKGGFAFVLYPSKGSPPPMRGKDGDSVHSRLPFRITPAYAGKSPLSDHIQNQAWDHPRLCGEKQNQCKL